MWGQGKARRRYLRVTAGIFAVLLVFFGMVSALFIVFPSTGSPARVDAVVVLGGGGDRLGDGLQLARDGRAPYLVLSMGLPWLPPGICTQHVGAAKVVCFQPDPDTTQGEAEGAARIAARYGWQSLLLVTTQDQVWRAHLRFQRCYPGRVYGASVPLAWYQWPYAVAYQWGASAKALLLQRSC